MANNINYFSSDNVIKMFPVSFERKSKHDRVLSEENLVSWIRGICMDSADTDVNSRYSYVVTEDLNENFAKSDSVQSQLFEFIIGGYYVSLSDCGFYPLIKSNSNIYVYIQEVQDTEPSFKHLANGEDINVDDEFQALNFIVSSKGEEAFKPELDDCYVLQLLTIDASGNVSIPESSKRSLAIVDGGEIL